jgi:SAM-dependent methyltransferase
MDPLNLAYLRNLFDRNRRVAVAEINLEEEADFTLLENRFDTVVCLHVLEHVDKDVQAMANILRALRSGGRACLAVPYGPSLHGTLDEVLRHHRRYAPAELEGKLTQAGFVVERVFSFNKLMAPAWWFHGRLLKRRSFDKVHLVLYDRLVWLRRRIERLLPWHGVSVIAIARKP